MKETASNLSKTKDPKQSTEAFFETEENAENESGRADSL
jgi:hypothetical protein